MENNNIVSEASASYGFTPMEQSIIHELINLRGHEDVLKSVLRYIKDRVYNLNAKSERDKIIDECFGSWSADPRSTEQIIADARSAFSSQIIRDF